MPTELSPLWLLFCALGAPPDPPAEALRPREVAPGVFVLSFSARFGSANAGWIACGDHAVLVGAPHPDAVPRLLAEAERTTGKAVTETIVLQGSAEGGAAARLLAERGIQLLDGAGGRRKLPAGALDIELIPLGHAAGPGDLAVRVASQGTVVLFTGAVCVHGPRIQLPGGNTPAWLRALAMLRELGPKVVVPGYGTTGGPELLERHERFLRELRRQVAHGVAQLWPAESVRRGVRLEPEWLVWMPYDNPTSDDIDHVRAELTVPLAPFTVDPFRADESGPRALAIIGDSPHEPGHLEDGLRPAFAAARVAVRFAVDPRALSAESLQAVQLLVILRDGYSWPEGPEKPPRQWMTREQEEAVVDFVAQGGGFLALHNATGLYPDRGPYLSLLGGTYEGHGPLERFRVRVTDAAHPVTRGVEEYEVADEQHTPRPDLARVRVILESRSAEGVTAAAGWLREVEKGRVCYLANGHTREALGEPMYRRLLVNGMRWCLRLGE